MKVVVVLLFVVHLGALHFKLMLVQQQNVLMCLTLNPWRRRKKVKEWEINQIFQDVWVTKLPWAEAMLGENGKVNMVKCCFCLQIKSRKKFMIPKFDNLKKHIGRHNYKVTKPNCNVGQYHMSIKSQHAKNERLFYNRGKDTITDMVVVGDVVGRKKRKFIQFCCNFLAFETRSSYD
jgi:hypothetical protein